MPYPVDLSKHEIVDPNIQALDMAWLVEGDAAPFWSAFREEITPILKDAHAAGAIAAVLPYQHKPLSLPDLGSAAWSICVVVICPPGGEAKPVGDELAKLALSGRIAQAAPLAALDILRLQPNLEMFYPAPNGLQREHRLVQWMEYVFSKPETREDYYNMQYVFSGPAMRRFHRNDKAGRFIGFETQERRHGTDSMPEWDVLHIFGFTPLQLVKVIPVFKSTWRAQAREVWGPDADAKAIMGSWDAMRAKCMSRVKQLPGVTLQGPSLLTF